MKKAYALFDGDGHGQSRLVAVVTREDVALVWGEDRFHWCQDVMVDDYFKVGAEVKEANRRLGKATVETRGIRPKGDGKR